MDPESIQFLPETEIDLIIADGMRNAAGGIYATSVYTFAQAVQRAFVESNGFLPAPEPRGEIVVTTDEGGQIVAVTRQDEEGRILSVLAESAPMPEGPDPLLGAAEWLAKVYNPGFDAAVLQQSLRIGYNRAQRLVDAVREKRGS